jgi:hypothetical protein
MQEIDRRSQTGGCLGTKNSSCRQWFFVIARMVYDLSNESMVLRKRE